jgi:cobalt-zinc-cadmium efflux system protein
MHATHAHSHDHGAKLDDAAIDRRLLLTIFLNAALTVAELVAGLFAGSLAMLSDAAHNFGDVIAVVFSLVARTIGRRPATVRHTYGFRRVEVMGALVNAVILIAVTVLIAREAVLRFWHPHPVMRGIMLLFGGLAFTVNLGSVLLLRKHDEKDTNTRSAFLHMIQDTFASLAVLVAALVADTPIGPYVDAALSLLVGGLVLRSALSLVSDTVSTILEGVPTDIDVTKLADSVATNFAPAQLHHIHVWAIGHNQRLLTAHVMLGQEMSGSDIERSLLGIKHFLHDNWGLNHCTLEPEVIGCENRDLLGRWEHVHMSLNRKSATPIDPGAYS